MRCRIRSGCGAHEGVTPSPVIRPFTGAVHHVPMPFTSDGIGGATDHFGFGADRYRNGSFSDVWTDVRRCAEHTFTAYAPACSCGWRGPARPVTDIAHMACRRSWTCDHAPAVTAPAVTVPPVAVSTTVACFDLSSC